MRTVIYALVGLVATALLTIYLGMWLGAWKFIFNGIRTPDVTSAFQAWVTIHGILLLVGVVYGVATLTSNAIIRLSTRKYDQYGHRVKKEPSAVATVFRGAYDRFKNKTCTMVQWKGQLEEQDRMKEQVRLWNERRQLREQHMQEMIDAEKAKRSSFYGVGPV